MDIRKIKKLIALLDEAELSELVIREGEEYVRLSKHHSSQAAPISHLAYHTPPVASSKADTESAILSESQSSASPTAGHKVRSPMVGTLFIAASPETPPFVSIGQTVNIGDTLCIIEAMKMFNEIEADRAGKIVDILVTNGTPVEYDQPLFIIA